MAPKKTPSIVISLFKPTRLIHPTISFEEEDEEEEEEEEFIEILDPFEPSTLDEFIGQEQPKEILKIIIEAANKESRSIPNILLTGAYGHGKTTLAKLIIKESGKNFKIIDGQSAEQCLVTLPNIVYIIDEAHNIPLELADSFNLRIDSGKLNIIACTTNQGVLPAPFKSRFRTIYLGDYEKKDISEILRRAAERKDILIKERVTTKIAERSKFNPRIALSILEFIREITVVKQQKESTIDIVFEAFHKLAIDEKGLTPIDRKYLSVLKTTTPLGLKYLSSVLSVDGSTIEEEIEPYLIKQGLIDRTARGRVRLV